MVARSFMKEICILDPGTNIPECHANCFCLSRKQTLGRQLVWAADLFNAGSKASCKAMAMAKDAGPKPTQTTS